MISSFEGKKKLFKKFALRTFKSEHRTFRLCEMYRIPVTNGTCDIVVWLVTWLVLW